MEAQAIPSTYGRTLPAPQTAVLPRPKERAAVRTARTGVRTAERSGMKLSVRAVSLFIAVLTVLLVIVYSYMQLSELSNEYAINTETLQALKKEERTLTRQAEAGVSLAEVEDYAVEVLGMKKPSADQIIYISLAEEDEAEVIPVKGFWGSVKQLFSTAMMKTKEFFD